MKFGLDLLIQVNLPLKSFFFFNTTNLCRSEGGARGDFQDCNMSAKHSSKISHMLATLHPGKKMKEKRNYCSGYIFATY